MKSRHFSTALLTMVVFVIGASWIQAETLAWYRFEDGAPGQALSVASDSVGGPTQDGFAMGAPIVFSADAPPMAGSTTNNLSIWLDGSYGQAILFDYFFPMHVSGPVTLEFFVKFHHQTHDAIIWSRVDSADGDRFNIFTTHPGTTSSFGFDYKDPSGHLHLIANPIAFAVTLGEWTHIAITRDGSTYEFYKNGVFMVHLLMGFPIYRARSDGRSPGEQASTTGASSTRSGSLTPC
jgi:hypothetical protein